MSIRRQTEYAILLLAAINSKCRVGARATALGRELLIQQQIRERQLSYRWCSEPDLQLTAPFSHFSPGSGCLSLRRQQKFMTPTSGKLI